MSFRKALITGIGVVTTIDLEHVPQFLFIGAPDADLPISKFELTVSGQSFQNISIQALIQAFSKYMMEGLLGADVKVSQVLKLADGFIPGKNVQIRITNAGATTPDIHTFSAVKGAFPIAAGQINVKQNDSETFSGFETVIFDPANLDYVDVTFSDGHKDKLQGVELDVLFSLNHQADADGRLIGMTVIDNQMDQITQVEIFATGGDITVLQVA